MIPLHAYVETVALIDRGPSRGSIKIGDVGTIVEVLDGGAEYDVMFGNGCYRQVVKAEQIRALFAVTFRRGLPSPEDVKRHQEEHPASDSPGRKNTGGLWLAIDPESGFGEQPCLIPLRTSNPDEPIYDARGDNPPGTTICLSEPTVLVQNGHTFWQMLSGTRWAARSIYVPVQANGLPIGVESVIEEKT